MVINNGVKMNKAKIKKAIEDMLQYSTNDLFPIVNRMEVDHICLYCLVDSEHNPHREDCEGKAILEMLEED